MKKRIWELDALRGLCIIGMVIVHCIYDMVELYRLVDWHYPAWFTFLKDWGGILFLLISGISITLGSRHLRRGLMVFACGLVCTAVTFGMVQLGFAGKGMMIWFGVLHCLGMCMLLWLLLGKLPTPVIAVFAAVFIALGYYLDACVRVDFPWLIPLGVLQPGFVSSDYFPLLPNLGFFLMGTVLGRTLYRKKESLLPKTSSENPAVRILTLCGRHSLWIYLAHQPVLSGIFTVISLFGRSV